MMQRGLGSVHVPLIGDMVSASSTASMMFAGLQP